MPEMDGHEATRRIRSCEVTRESRERVSIYALSADVLKEQVDAAKSLGMNGHLAKPVDINSLSRVLAGVDQTRVQH